MTAPRALVVVGAGAAGVTTAETLRRQGYDGRLTVLGAETRPPYDRPPLSKQVLAGRWEVDRVRLRAPEVYERLGIDLRTGTPAVRLDRAGRAVELADGTRLTADAVVVATGVRPRPLPGADGLTGVHVLRTADDALALRADLTAGRRLVVAGAGLLGTEAAIAAAGLGADVTLVGPDPVALRDVVGPHAAALAADVHRALGLRLLRGRVTGVEGRAGAVTGVRLADGELLPADTVLAATGSLPVTDWLAGSGVPVADGVVCDALGAAGPGVWAVGDVAARPGPDAGRPRRQEHRTHATESAVAVARNLLAGDGARPFTVLPYFWTDQDDLKIQVFGEIPPDDPGHVVDGDPAERRFTAVHVRGGRVRGAVAVNLPRAVQQLRPLVENAAPWPPEERREGPDSGRSSRSTAQELPLGGRER
ncbi:FAD-dependent oxidoreductase [Streptomyces heilongjiangensis]|uniref:NAD(P)/FAD-dependent oxidoreductase n=1 Tax=Streptomyces heilongjiangensis TaxID=945052 RepID=A0ABW1BD06_9ACTN|nr:FAD-dependent oxidoreductase [Streptomyces heilongjiangensis]MDC2948821.1 FAD-dependent oxidoreductase [Streptomyces heilongjiangensis]